MKAGNTILTSYGTTIFEVMSRLAAQHGAINLGQGTPEGLEPPSLVERAAQALLAGPHQYPPMTGLPALREAIARHQHQHYGLTVDPVQEVIVTSGATEALADCLFGLLEPGDEVIVLEPAYDSYLPILRRAGAIPRLVRLSPPDWSIPVEKLKASFGPRTRAIILNTPANPCARVFTADELELLAGLILEQENCIAICDEVYEHLVFPGGPSGQDQARHIPLMTVAGMRDRCVRIGSFGKIFSITNWKVGYIVAPPLLMQAIARTHQYLTFSTPTAPQAALAWGLQELGDYIGSLAGLLQQRRDRLSAGLSSLGLTPLPGHGTYFLCADISARTDLDDQAFCQWLVREGGVAAVPVSAFYAPASHALSSDGPPPSHIIRFCFAKTEGAIDQALERMGKALG